MPTPNPMTPEEIQLWKPIGKLIGDRCRQQHVSHHELATRIGYATSTSVTEIVRGNRRIPVERGREIALILGLDPDKFVAEFPVQVTAKHRATRLSQQASRNGNGKQSQMPQMSLLRELAASAAKIDLTAAAGPPPQLQPKRVQAQPLSEPQMEPQAWSQPPAYVPAGTSDSEMTIGMRLDLLMEAIAGLSKSDRQRLIALVELIEE